jgi:hypothetical protein
VNNHPPSDRDLESFIDQELKKLPSLKAPPHLIASVLKIIEQRAARPWWQQSLWLWPPAARVLALALFSSLGLLCVTGAVLGFQSAWEWTTSGIAPYLGNWAPSLGAPMKPWSVLLGQGATWLAAFMGSPWLWGAAGFGAALYLMLIATGSALWQLMIPSSR